MQIMITGHHVDITDSIREAVNNKGEKLAKHFPDLDTINVILTVEKNQQTAEASTHYLREDFSATASADDLYAALAAMTDKLSSLLQRRKEIVKSHSHDKPAIAEEEDTLDEAV